MDDVFEIMEEESKKGHLIKVDPGKGLFWISLNMQWIDVQM